MLHRGRFRVRWRQYPKNLFIPQTLPRAADIGEVHVSAVIPIYKPPELLVSLVQRLLSDPLIAQAVVVDDATPAGWESMFVRLRQVAAECGRGGDLTIMHLPHNLQRAGAVNAGLGQLSDAPSPHHDILVLDDDVVLAPHAVEALVRQLHASEAIGAVCTQARVLNRRQNMLTRLQGLEYVGFNVARVADRGFLYGPLIMHGLSSLIRSTALLQEVGGYDRQQLLEDYDLTVRMKARGYAVALAETSVAYTVVPASLGQWWRQRVRWQFGGLKVIRTHWRTLSAVFPDALSHWVTVTLLVSVLISLIWHQAGSGESSLITLVRSVSIGMTIILYLFQLSITFTLDRGKDWVDIVLRATLVMEFIYALLQSLVLFGSYAFFVYHLMVKKMVYGGLPSRFPKVVRALDYVFSWCGYTTTWGTK